MELTSDLRDRYSLAGSHLKTASSFTAKDQSQLDRQLKFWHYQSIYWGAERIWTGELVRVLVDPRHLPEATYPLSPGAAGRALFCKISGVYKDEENVTGMITGALYELKDVSLLPVDTPSVPLNGSYMPIAPEGYIFHRITPEEEEVHIDIEFVAGRYYPLPSHLSTRQACDQILKEYGEGREEEEEEEDGLNEDQRRVALAGLLPAYRLYVRVSPVLPPLFIVKVLMRGSSAMRG